MEFAALSRVIGSSLKQGREKGWGGRELWGLWVVPTQHRGWEVPPSTCGWVQCKAQGGSSGDTFLPKSHSGTGGRIPRTLCVAWEGPVKQLWVRHTSTRLFLPALELEKAQISINPSVNPEARFGFQMLSWCRFAGSKARTGCPFRGKGAINGISPDYSYSVPMDSSLPYGLVSSPLKSGDEHIELFKAGSASSLLFLDPCASLCLTWTYLESPSVGLREFLCKPHFPLLCEPG